MIDPRGRALELEREERADIVLATDVRSGDPLLKVASSGRRDCACIPDVRVGDGGRLTSVELSPGVASEYSLSFSSTSADMRPLLFLLPRDRRVEERRRSADLD